jgi:Surface adhesin CshA non-repetitive domain 2
MVWNFRRLWLCMVVMLCGMVAAPAYAQSCAPATTQGTAPAGWETYCWLDFTNYNDVTARSSSGQNMVFTLTDGSTLSLNVKVTPTAATGFNNIAAPSWTGAAVGNTAFLGIPGKPILYTASAGAKSVTFSNILITPPPGAPAVTAYAFVAADAESTNGGETLQFVTNGGGWTILDQVNPISGNVYPTISGRIEQPDDGDRQHDGGRFARGDVRCPLCLYPVEQDYHRSAHQCGGPVYFPHYIDLIGVDACFGDDYGNGQRTLYRRCDIAGIGDPADLDRSDERRQRKCADAI